MAPNLNYTHPQFSNGASHQSQGPRPQRIGGAHRPDALALAQELLVRFGGLAALVHASLEELQTVAGIGPARAAQVKAALTLGLRLLTETGEEHPQIRSPADVAHLLMPEMGFLEHEELCTVLLDTKHRVR